MGACTRPPHPCIVTEYLALGRFCYLSLLYSSLSNFLLSPFYFIFLSEFLRFILLIFAVSHHGLVLLSLYQSGGRAGERKAAAHLECEAQHDARHCPRRALLAFQGKLSNSLSFLLQLSVVPPHYLSISLILITSFFALDSSYFPSRSQIRQCYGRKRLPLRRR